MIKLSSVGRDEVKIPLKVLGVTGGTASNGSPYTDYELTDGKETVHAKRWGKDSASEMDLVGTIKVFDCSCRQNGAYTNYNVTGLREVIPTDMVDASQFESGAKKHMPDPNEMFNYMFGKVRGFKNKTLREVVGKVMFDYKEEMLIHPAATGVHHNFEGGLMYHTYRMFKDAEFLSGNYIGVNEELLLSAVICHDIGKIHEIVKINGKYDYSTKGRLEGHLVMGADIVRIKAFESGVVGEEWYEQEAIDMLAHCILSHHGNPEWGAVQRPQTIEAYLLHEIDMIDSRVTQFEDKLDQLGLGEASAKVNTLDGVKVYRSTLEDMA